MLISPVNLFYDSIIQIKHAAINFKLHVYIFLIHNTQMSYLIEIKNEKIHALNQQYSTLILKEF